MGALIYVNYSKANQIDGVKKAVLEACEKDNSKSKIEDNKLKMVEGATNQSAFLNEVARMVKLEHYKKRNKFKEK